MRSIFQGVFAAPTNVQSFYPAGIKLIQTHLKKKKKIVKKDACL